MDQGHKHKQRREMRQRDINQALPGVGTVNAGRLQAVLWHRLQAGIKHNEGKGHHMPDAVQNNQQPGRPGLRHPKQRNTELRQKIGHQTVVAKQPLDRQRTHHRRDDEGQQRCADVEGPPALSHLVHAQRQRKAQEQHKGRGGKGIQQGEAQRTCEFGGALGRGCYSGTAGLRRGAAAGQVAVADVQAQHLAKVLQPDKTAHAQCAAIGPEHRALCDHLLRAKRAALSHRDHLHLHRAAAHRQVKGDCQRQRQQQQHQDC